MNTALAAAPVASAAKGDEIPGVDVKEMTPSEIAALRQLMEKFPSMCGKSQSLLASVRTDSKCKRSVLAAKWLQRMLKDGYLPSEVEERFSDRYLSKKRFDIDVSGASVRGDAKAPITIVEFSDFECPHCKQAEPILKTLLEEFPQVKLVFLNYPLPMHQNAPNAAAAALAAGKQGRFWSYHDKLFENQSKLTLADLLRYAQELKLDVSRFQTDMEVARVRVAKERSLGEKVELSGTPTFFINGRRYTDPLTVEAMRAWLEEELAR